MRRHGAGPATVQRAVHVLAARGLVEARPGRGTFVAADRRRRAGGARPRLADASRSAPRPLDAGALEDLLRPAPPGMLVLSTGYLPEDLQPRGALGQALARAARRPGAWGAMPAEGLTALRALLARRLGGGHTAQDVIVTDGGQAALTACLRGLAPAGRPRRRRVADLPRRPRGGARRRTSSRCPCRATRTASGPSCSPTRSPPPAPGSSTSSRRFANPHGAVLAPDRRADVLAAVRGRRRVPDRGRPAARPRVRPRAAAAAARARRPRRPRRPPHARSRRWPRPGCGSARSPPAARRSPGSAPRGSSRTSSSPARSRRPRSSCSARRPGRATSGASRLALRERRDALVAAVDAGLGPGRVAASSGGHPRLGPARPRRGRRRARRARVPRRRQGLRRAARGSRPSRRGRTSASPSPPSRRSGSRKGCGGSPRSAGRRGFRKPAHRKRAVVRIGTRGPGYRPCTVEGLDRSRRAVSR